MPCIVAAVRGVVRPGGIIREVRACLSLDDRKNGTSLAEHVSSEFPVIEQLIRSKKEGKIWGISDDLALHAVSTYT